MKKLLLSILLLLVACTGTSEPPLDLLLAVGDGGSVAFYPAGSDDAVAVGSWSIGEQVVDLLRLEGESRLWVLTPSKLLAYPLSGGTLTSPPSETAASVSLEPGADCAAGRLLPGEARLLLDCRGGNVWTVPLAAPELDPLDTSGDEAETVYLLGPDDLLTRVTPTLEGFQLKHPGSGSGYSYTVDTGTATDHLVAVWSGETLLIAVDSGSETRLYVWAAGSDPPKLSGDPFPLTGVAVVLPLSDGWLIGGEHGYLIHRQQKDDLQRPTPTTAALVTPNLYAYLAGPGKLTVLDLLDPALREHSRSFPASPRGLAWLPVGE